MESYKSIKYLDRLALEIILSIDLDMKSLVVLINSYFSLLSDSKKTANITSDKIEKILHSFDKTSYPLGPIKNEHKFPMFWKCRTQCLSRIGLDYF